MEFKTTPSGFRLNGKKFFLLSGEVHYFRIPRRLWKAHLEKLKEARFSSVSTYVPWDWHEVREGEFDFTGKTHPQRDLVGFLKLAHSLGLFLIVKPGPFILAEYARHGLPEWLLKNYPQILTKRLDGKPSVIGQVTLLDDIFLKKVFHWYDKVMPIVSTYQISKGGPIIMMQVCNEVGVLSWLANEPDYADTPMAYYRKFLKEKYRTIENFNDVYKKDYSDFCEAAPPLTPSLDTPEDYALDLNWHKFWGWYWGIYIKKLKEKIESYKINLQFFHNLPGWIYGRANEFPMNVSSYDGIAAMCPEVVLAVDHIPENVTYRNFYDEAICNQVALAVQKRKQPLYVAEMQSGTREHNVVVYSHELELFYLGSLFHDTSGMNLYMFSQGKNPQKRGVFGPIFYWQAPLSWQGKETEFYGVAHRFGNFVSKYSSLIMRAKRRPQICALYYRPYFANWLPRKTSLAHCGLDYDAKLIREKIWHDGLLKATALFSYDFDIRDLELVTAKELSNYKQVWSISLDYMDGNSQKKLLDFVKAKGNLVAMPRLPRFDLGLRKCEILREGLGIEETSKENHTPPKADIFDIKGINVLNPMVVYDSPGAKIFARTPSGSPCGIIKNYHGKLTLLGTAFPHGIKEHLWAYRRFFEKDKIAPWAESSSPDIYLQQLFADDYALLFAANYHMVKKEGNITFTHPVGNRKMPLGRISLGPSSCKIFYVKGNAITQIWPEKNDKNRV